MTKECYIHGKGNDTFSTGLNSFVLVDVESLSLEDIFMQHEPVTQTQENLKSLITEAIEKKEKNFYKSVYDPSLKVIETEKEITLHLSFAPNEMPATYCIDFDRYARQKGKYYCSTTEQWPIMCSKMACEFMPERNSKIGTRVQYAAFLGVVIKQLVENGTDVAKAWHLVCEDSKKLGVYAKRAMSLTGKRCIAGFYDLANTYKLLDVNTEDGTYYLASGCWYSKSDKLPLAYIRKGNTLFSDRYSGKRPVHVEMFNEYRYVPWVVLS